MIKFKQTVQALFFLCLVVLGACTEKDDLLSNDENFEQNQDDVIDLEKKETIKILVFSDPHLMHPDLLVNDGPAFENYLNHDRKLLRESTYILDELLKQILIEKPDVVLIPGDLTKDGARISHEMLISDYLKPMQEAGIKTFIVPGNHDVNNPHAVYFDDDQMVRVASVSAQEFAELYGDYGYGDAIARDSKSLTYVAQPYANLRVLGIDACMYYDNDFSEKNICVTGGTIQPETMEFIRQQARKASEDNVRLIALMHHGIVQHWDMQETLMADYLVKDWRTFADEFAELGISVVFTGHFHSQDIVKHDSAKPLFDIETGSTVTYPCPFRLIDMTADRMVIRTKRIESIEYDTNGMPLGDYAKEYVDTGIRTLVTGTFDEIVGSLNLSPALTGIVNGVVDKLGGLASNAIIAHYEGDEVLTSDEQKDINSLCNTLKLISADLSDLLKRAAMGLWTDITPADNDLEINLLTGETL